MNPCICGHEYGQHSGNSTHPCLACVNCILDKPQREPHVMVRCDCSGYEPAVACCEICDRPTTTEVCDKCAPIIR